MIYTYCLRLCAGFCAAILLASLSAGCVSNSKETVKLTTPTKLDPEIAEAPEETDPKKMTGNLRLNNVLKTAFSQVGTPYYYGGTTPQTGFDCSGFVRWVYGTYGINLPRTTKTQIAAGTPIDRKDLKPGDLVFFGKRKKITHVGIYTGDNNYIHSPRRGKPVQENSVDYRSRGEYYVGARRLLTDHNITAIDPDVKTTWLTQTKDPAKAATLIAKAPQKLVITRTPTVEASSGQVPTAATPTPPTTVADIAQMLAATEAPKATTQTSQTAATAQPPQHSEATRHKIKVASGDTLYTLAHRYSVTVDDFMKANEIPETKKANLQLGQLLVVPDNHKHNI